MEEQPLQGIENVDSGIEKVDVESIEEFKRHLDDIIRKLPIGESKTILISQYLPYERQVWLQRELERQFSEGGLDEFPEINKGFRYKAHNQGADLLVMISNRVPQAQKEIDAAF